MRGTQYEYDKQYPLYGIIPACAGNTMNGQRVIYQDRDHPRVCGEHCPLGAVPVRVAGSSPRVRGTLEARLYAVGAVGIIPACAGNTLKNPSSKYHSD